MTNTMSPITFVVVTVMSLITGFVDSYAITGIAAGVQSSGQRPFRTEINQFATSGAAFDLYILSLQQMQQTDQSNTISFFQVAGQQLMVMCKKV